MSRELKYGETIYLRNGQRFDLWLSGGRGEGNTNDGVVTRDGEQGKFDGYYRWTVKKSRTEIGSGTVNYGEPIYLQVGGAKTLFLSGGRGEGKTNDGVVTRAGESSVEDNYKWVLMRSFSDEVSGPVLYDDQVYLRVLGKKTLWLSGGRGNHNEEVVTRANEAADLEKTYKFTVLETGPCFLDSNALPREPTTPNTDALNYGDTIYLRVAGEPELWLSGGRGAGKTNDGVITRDGERGEKEPYYRWTVMKSLTDLGTGTPLMYGDTIYLKAGGEKVLFLSGGRGEGKTNDGVVTRDGEPGKDVATTYCWTVMKTRDAQGEGAVKCNDTIYLKVGGANVLFLSGGRGNLQAEVVTRSGQGGEADKPYGFVVSKVRYGRYRTWMRNSSDVIGNKTLRHVTLPVAHDAGTYNLSRSFANDTPPGNAESLSKSQLSQMNWMQKVCDDVKNIDNIFKYVNPIEFIWSALADASRDLAITTERTIAGQLDGGIRGLDLRVYYNSDDGQFYTYHTVVGSKLSEVLDDIADFLSTTDGEVLYVTFSNFEGFPEDPATLRLALCEQILSKLGDYVHPSSGDTDFFDATLNTITSGKSRAILVMELSVSQIPSDKRSQFWDKSYLATTGDTTKKVYGEYANSSDPEVMVTKQLTNQGIATDISKPFALYLTLTPNKTEITEIVIGGMGKALAQLSAQIAAAAATVVSPIGIKVAAAVATIAGGLEAYNQSLSFHTLRELTDRVNKTIVQRALAYFQPLDVSTNEISMIYLDYFERTNLVDLAITYSRIP